MTVRGEDGYQQQLDYTGAGRGGTKQEGGGGGQVKFYPTKKGGGRDKV